MSLAPAAAAGAGLPGFALFAVALAAAGLPVYIHAPKAFAEAHGVGLAALGAVLAGLRLIDVVQDPALGWLAARLSARRGAAVAAAGVVMAAAMAGLLAVAPPVDPLLWFALTLAALFSAYSFLTITFYAAGVEKAQALGAGGHVRLAGWREAGALAGVTLAAVAPALLAGVTEAPFAAYAAAFALLLGAAHLAMRGQWAAPAAAAAPPAAGATAGAFAAVLADPAARRLLAIAFLNAAPVAVTSTLFLFYVESRLVLPGLEGPLLVLFFAAAAAAVPLWTRLAARLGARRALIAGMGLSVAAFACALPLGPGDLLPFALVCLASGAALGADMTLLPALFAARLARLGGAAAPGFGLWSFVSKATLAVAAATVLPALGLAGFAAGAADNPPGALALLALLYAGLPCALKLLALALLVRTRAAES